MATVEVAALVVFGVALAAVVLTGLNRVAAREAEKAHRAVVCSPWNDIDRLEVGQARVGGVVALDEEMLIELCWPTDDGEPPMSTWLVGPTNGAAMVTLRRWSEAESLVRVYRADTRFLLQTGQARVNVRAGASSTPTGRAPTE